MVGGDVHTLKSDALSIRFQGEVVRRISRAIHFWDRFRVAQELDRHAAYAKASNSG